MEYKYLTGDKKRNLIPDPAEREDGPGNAESRKLIKTLLGNAGAARGLLIAGAGL